MSGAPHRSVLGHGTGAHANNVTRLVGSPAFRLRVGDFRTIFEETETDIFVTTIAPRGNAYD
jgi:mRNA interferase RelE/StbE